MLQLPVAPPPIQCVTGDDSVATKQPQQQTFEAMLAIVIQLYTADFLILLFDSRDLTLTVKLHTPTRWCPVRHSRIVKASPLPPHYHADLPRVMTSHDVSSGAVVRAVSCVRLNQIVIVVDRSVTTNGMSESRPTCDVIKHTGHVTQHHVV